MLSNAYGTCSHLTNQESKTFMTVLAVGQQAPSFNIPDATGTPYSLEMFTGKWLFIYFYPKALTPGCTTQACALRDGKNFLHENNIKVLGVSADEPSLLKKFIEKEELNFPLLSDPTHAMCEAYGAWQQKQMYGKTYMGIQRMGVLIDARGTVRCVWSKIKPENQLVDLQTWFKSNI